MKDKEIKANRLEVNKRFPEFGIRLILKYKMYLLGNRLSITDTLFNSVTIGCDDFGIQQDVLTVDLVAGSTKIILWRNSPGFNVYI